MTDEELMESENIRLIVSNDLGDIVTTYTFIVDKVLGSDGPNGTDILELSTLIPEFRQKFICTVCNQLLTAEFYRTEHCLHFVCAGCRNSTRKEDKECKFCKDWDSYSISETGDSSLCLVLRGYKKFCAYFIQSLECRRMLEIKTEVDHSFQGESLALMLREAALRDHKEDPPLPQLILREPHMAPLLKLSKLRRNPFSSNSSDDIDFNEFGGFKLDKPTKKTQNGSTQTNEEEPKSLTSPIAHLQIQGSRSSVKERKEKNLSNESIMQPVVRLSNLGLNASCLLNESVIKSLKPTSTTNAIVNGVKKKVAVIRAPDLRKIDLSSAHSFSSLAVSATPMLMTENAATATTPIISLSDLKSAWASSSSAPISSSSILGTVVPKQEGANKKLKVRLPKGKVVQKRGCRCGNASTVPGKLTCCGQRCPCYVDAKACLDCRCKGCRNPHLPGGRKLLQGINAVIDTRTNKTVTLAPHPITISNSLPSVSVVSSSQLCQITSQGQHFTPLYPIGTVANFGGISIPLPIISVSHGPSVPTLHHNNGTPFATDLEIKSDPLHNHYEY